MDVAKTRLAYLSGTDYHFFMIKIIFAFTVSFPIYAVCKSYIPSGCGTNVICKEIKNAQGELDGPQTCFNARDEKIKVIEARWKQDLLVGDFWCGSDEGQVRIKAHYKDGELDGSYQEFNSDSKDWTKSENYRNGKLNGVSIRRLADGMKNIIQYKDNQQHGYQIVIDRSGKILSKSNCQINNQKLDMKECAQISIPGYESEIRTHQAKLETEKKKDENGLFEKKDAAGQVVSRYRMIGGKIEGKYEIFFKNGNPSLVTTYKNGNRIEEKEYFEQGQLLRETTYQGLWPDNEKQYYQNGKLKSESVAHIKNQSEALYDFKSYHDNGKPYEISSYITSAFDDWRSGRYEGEFKIFDENGHTIAEGHYKSGKKHGPWIRVNKKNRYENLYRDDALVSETVFEKDHGKQLRKREFMSDGSIKSDVKSPDYKED